MDDVTALRDALLDSYPYARDAEEYALLAARLDALIAAVCAGLVEALAATDSVPPPWSGNDGLVDAWHARGKAIRQALAAFPRPEEPRVERCAVCGTPIAEHPLTDACAIAQESEAR